MISYAACIIYCILFFSSFVKTVSSSCYNCSNSIAYCAYSDSPTSSSCLYCNNTYMNLGSRCVQNSSENDLFYFDWSSSLTYAFMSLLLFQVITSVVIQIITTDGKHGSVCNIGSQNNLFTSGVMIQNTVAFNYLNGITNLSLKPSTLSSEISELTMTDIFEGSNWVRSFFDESLQAQTSDSISSALWIVYLLTIYLILRIIIRKTENGLAVFQKGIGSLLFQIGCLIANAAVFLGMYTIINSETYFRSSNGINFLNALSIVISFGFSGLLSYEIYSLTTKRIKTTDGSEVAELNAAYKKIVCNQSPFLDQENPRWVQKNYALISFYRQIIIYPIITAALINQPIACGCVLAFLQILAVGFSAYVRPMQDLFSNSVEISAEILYLVITVLVLSSRIIISELNTFSEEYDQNNVNKLSQMKSIDVSIFVILLSLISLIVLRSIHEIIYTLIKKKQAKEADLIYVTKQLDSIERVQMQVYGFLQESEPCFKIRPEYLENAYLEQQFLQFKQKERFSKYSTGQMSSSQYTFGSPDNSKHQIRDDKRLNRTSTLMLTRMSPVRSSLPITNNQQLQNKSINRASQQL